LTTPSPFISCTGRIVAGVLLAAAPAAFAGRQGPVDLSRLQTPLYTVQGDAFVGHNGPRYGNRPLYCDHIYAIAIGGDKPYAVLGSGDFILGNLMFALVREGKGTWLQSASDITATYRPGRMEWAVKDVSWGATVVHLFLVPTAHGPGMAVRLQVEQAQPGDTIVWASGAASHERGHILWEYDMTSQRSRFTYRGFVPADCDRNRVMAQGARWTLQTGEGGRAPAAQGRCSATSEIKIGDAGRWDNPRNLIQSLGGAQPIACGVVPITADGDIYWSLGGPGTDEAADPAQAFDAGWRYQQTIEDRIAVDTPDPWLNAAVHASNTAENGCFRDGIFTHSGMRWGVALLGWRTLFGATTYGWHDNVKTDARTFISHQITESDKTAPHADPKTELTSQAPDSRMFGKGRIDLDHPHHYDMQSQFFDQVQHAWRWTGDPDLEKLLRPSLELHCDYLRECFDPANLGIYESYANTWPTDDQWYNGGGTSEETAYAYRAELTALTLAQRAGDSAAVQRHTANLARIRQGFFNLLWIPAKGFPGGYREQGGLERLHESGWLYAIFCPIDAGLLDREQAAQSLQYTEWGLERVHLPYGGEQCWPSNWVPSIWSVREMWAGDNYQLALAYFQTGLADDGWTLLRGTFPQQLIFGPVPGDMGHPAGGTDFNDCNSMFSRAVVEGLFGYRPDYPSGRVVFEPQFPKAWDHASIKTPDVSISYRRDGTGADYQLALARPAAIDLELPISTTAVTAVTVNGARARWHLAPGFGDSILQVDVAPSEAVAVHIETENTPGPFPAVHLSGNVGDSVALRTEEGRLVDFHDPQGALQAAHLADGVVTAALSQNAGDHLVFGLVQYGQTQQWRLFKLHIANPRADEAIAQKTHVGVSAGARWQTVDMRAQFNGDIRSIYRQKYLSPRPNTCSLRLATDGYSTWEMVLGQTPRPPPDVGLQYVDSLSDGRGNLKLGSGVPMQWTGGVRNIAFTSLWDNWPRRVEVPIGRSGDAVWFLLCGTTNPMQVRIANAVLRLNYADGAVEKLEIMPPFNFWTLCPMGGVDYSYERDGFALPRTPPVTALLGRNCRAVLLGWNLRPGIALRSVELETLSQEVVIGLMGITLMNR
jgi:hypothetical protein